MKNRRLDLAVRTPQPGSPDGVIQRAPCSTATAIGSSDATNAAPVPVSIPDRIPREIVPLAPPVSRATVPHSTQAGSFRGADSQQTVAAPPPVAISEIVSSCWLSGSAGAKWRQGSAQVPTLPGMFISRTEKLREFWRSHRQ